MKHLKLYEDFDFNDDDFDFEEDAPYDIPYDFEGNELFYNFLIDKKILGDFIKEFEKSDWNPPSLKKYLDSRKSSYIENAFDWGYAYDNSMISWTTFDKEWKNKLKNKYTTI